MMYRCDPFAKEPYKKDDILQKRPTILCITTPCITTPVMMYRSDRGVPWYNERVTRMNE